MVLTDPFTVIVEVVTGVERVVATVNVDWVVEVVKDVGLNVQVAPVGQPEVLSVTVLLKLLKNDMVTLYVAVALAWMVCEAGETESEYVAVVLVCTDIGAV